MNAKLIEVADLLLRKNRQYGGDNILFTGLVGVATRLVDKVYRFRNLTQTNTVQEFESVEDTLRDIVGYCIIGILLREDKWGSAVNPQDVERVCTALDKSFLLAASEPTLVNACIMMRTQVQELFFLVSADPGTPVAPRILMALAITALDALDITETQREAKQG